MNAIRSPMAEAIAKSILKKDVFVQSAGLQEGEHDHFVDAVLAEINLDLRHHQPRIIMKWQMAFSMCWLH